METKEQKIERLKKEIKRLKRGAYIMEKDISFRVPKDLCKDCINSCQFNLKQQTECYLKRKPYILVETEIPTTWEEFKDFCKDIKDCEVEDYSVIFFFQHMDKEYFKLAEFKQEGSLYIAEKNHRFNRLC